MDERDYIFTEIVEHLDSVQGVLEQNDIDEDTEDEDFQKIIECVNEIRSITSGD